MKNKICVYTCITGDYDSVKEINCEKGIDYYLFTNNKNLKSNSWKVIYIENEDNLSNVKLARKIKILGYPSITNNYEVNLWMDGAVEFKKPIINFINSYLGKDDKFVAFTHSERNNILDEIYACVKMGKETKDNAKKLIKFYDDEKYNYDNGLIESTVFIKRTNDETINRTMDLWFFMILNYSHRDQLSFNYCIKKTGLKIKLINKKVFSNDWFNWKKHINYSNKISYCKIYFGDENKNYKLENDIQKNYEINQNVYSFKVKCPDDCDKIKLLFSNVPFSILLKILVNKKEPKTIYSFNYINYNGQKLFYNENAIIEIFDKFKKNKEYMFELKIDVLKDKDINLLLEELCIENILLNDKLNNLEQDYKSLKHNYDEIKKYLDNVLNSKGWKMLEKIRNIKKKK